MLETIRELCDKTVESENESKILEVILAENVNVEKARKCLEISMHNCSWRAQLCRTAKNDENQAGTTGEGYKRNDKIIIKSGERNYADILKDMSSVINMKEIGVKVDRVKRTDRGDLLIEFKKEQEAQKLKQALKEKMGHMEVIHKKDEAILHILDITPNIEIGQIEECLRREAPGIELEVASVRLTKDGNQMATVKTRKRNVKKLLEMEKIDIGWVECRILERVHVTRCYRCLQYGHKRDECTGEDRTGQCMKCGQTGHMARECENEELCVTCGTKGHRADSLACIEYRKALGQERRRRSSIRNSQSRGRSKSRKPRSETGGIATNQNGTNLAN
ncbi:unnamed protein product [Phyllotreta striolata]|uniref:CCHC-type domain-containing protein n=1 Tax=Phyllotreta striolata TaxID=444603 RepID=A0A9P0DXG7_PHYSR|nr:unnamed protein product [Phyllotreta striolata]